MRKRCLLYVIPALVGMIAALNAGAEHFGEVTVQIDGQPEQRLVAKSAIFYENVAIDYDTTVLVKSAPQTRLLYSPQLSQGTDYVVHLLLASPADTAAAKIPAYDVYFNLGDTLFEQLRFHDADSNVFLYTNGSLTPQKLYSRKQNGTFNLKPMAGAGGVGGSFDTEFEFPVPGVPGQYQRYHMKGVLSIPVASMRVGDSTNISQAEDHSKRLKRNLAIAVVISAFVILFAIR